MVKGIGMEGLTTKLPMFTLISLWAVVATISLIDLFTVAVRRRTWALTLKIALLLTITSLSVIWNYGIQAALAGTNSLFTLALLTKRIRNG